MINNNCWRSICITSFYFTMYHLAISSLPSIFTFTATTPLLNIILLFYKFILRPNVPPSLLKYSKEVVKDSVKNSNASLHRKYTFQVPNVSLLRAAASKFSSYERFSVLTTTLYSTYWRRNQK